MSSTRFVWSQSAQFLVSVADNSPGPWSVEVTQRGDLGTRKALTRPRPPLACRWSGGGESGPQGRTAQEAKQTLLVLTLVDVEGCHVVHDDGAPEVLILILGLVSI